MADSLTISDLPPVEEVLISQVMAIEDSENTQQVTIDQLRKFINQYLVEIIDANFDEQKNEGIYKLTGAITNAPASNDAAYILKVVKNGAAIVQTAYSIDLAGQYPTTFRRRWDGLAWSSWTDSKRSYTPWAINSGKQTVKGENGIMNGVGTIAVTFDTSVPMFCTVANGTTYEIKSVPPFQFEVDGTYNVFYDPIQNDVQAFTNKINIQDAAPESPNRNDVWLNTSQTPLVFSFWDTVKWTEINYIFMGTVTVASGNIVTINNRSFNVNGVSEKKVQNSLELDYTKQIDIWPELKQCANENRFYISQINGVIMFALQEDQTRIVLAHKLNVTSSGDESIVHAFNCSTGGIRTRNKYQVSKNEKLSISRSLSNGYQTNIKNAYLIPYKQY